MNTNTLETHAATHPASMRRLTWGNRLTYFCVLGLAVSSVVKFIHPPNAVAYMASLGYQAGDVFVIGCLEMLTAILFGLRWTRPLGLLLVSSYLGGAIAAHVASHPLVMGGPGMTYMLTHPVVGVLPASVFLLSAWIGTWLRHPEVVDRLTQAVEDHGLTGRMHYEAARASRP